MRATWRWFGPSDPVRIRDVMQTSATSVETTLEDQPVGAIWPDAAIMERKRQVEISEDGRPSGLKWDILGGIPIHDDIKLGRSDRSKYVDVFKENVRRLSKHGVHRILFTVMPLLDWVRTDLSRPFPSGVEGVAFDVVDFAVFDIYLIARADAAQSYPAPVLEAAETRLEAMEPTRREALKRMLVKGLPGGPRFYESDEFRSLLSAYGSIGVEAYRQNLIEFLGEVATVCEEEGAVLGLHPDDPPFPVCGLPRIASTLSDFRKIFEGAGSPAVGMIFCSGSLGSRPDNDLATFIEEVGHRIVYAHPRAVKRSGEYGSFFEVEHLAPNADVDLFEVLRLLLQEERKREPNSQVWSEIPYRADHAVRMLYDQLHDDFVPGYTPVGLVKATAELRGMIHALQRTMQTTAANS